MDAIQNTYLNRYAGMKFDYQSNSDYSSKSGTDKTNLFSTQGATSPIQNANASEDAKAKQDSENSEIYQALEDASKVNDMTPEQAMDEINKIQKNIAGFQNEIKDANSQLIEQQGLLREKQAEIDKVNDEKKALEQEIVTNKKIYSRIMDNINRATEKLSDEKKEAQEEVIYKAMSEYNEDKDGNWNDYIQKKMQGLDINSTQMSYISSLESESKTTLNKLGSLKVCIKDKNKTVSKLNAGLSCIKESINSYNAQKLGAQNAIDKAGEKIKGLTVKLVQQKEWDLAKANNIDLTEKMNCGKPRYVFTQGKKDKKYHIYDLAQSASLARLYAPGKGFDIIKSGNGYLSKWKELDENSCGGNTAMFMNPCGQFETFKACYDTYSPLSFDLDGDGINTSDDLVDFDIDGDGVLDKINNSLDGVLVFDKDNDGISGMDGSECFGDNTDLDNDGVKDGYKNGFDALKALADKENLISEKDNVLDLDDLLTLEEKYGLKMKVGYLGETKSFEELGITEINLAGTDSTSVIKNFDGKNNDLMVQDGATFIQNGETKDYADIWHSKKYEEESIFA